MASCAGGVLDRHLACGEPRQRAHVGGRLDADRIWRERVAIAAKPRRLERVQLGRDVGPPAVDAQPERRMRIVRIEHASCRPGQSCSSAATSQRGCAVRVARSHRPSRVCSARSRWNRRSTALTKPAARAWPSSRAALTVSATAACSATSPDASWYSPISSRARSAGAAAQAAGPRARPASRAGGSASAACRSSASA